MVKHADPGKAARHERLLTFHTPDRYFVQVVDNGTGIPADRRAEVFGMFKRFHGAAIPGSGLGLYMVRRQAKRLGAKLSFASSPARTTFHLEFLFACHEAPVAGNRRAAHPVGMRKFPALASALLTFAACTAPTVRIADRADDAKLANDVRALVAELGDGVHAAVWLGPAGSPPSLAWNVETPMPCASAIKAAYLVELFAARADALDQPLPGADGVLADARHPAVAHFSEAQRATARKALGGASTRRIAEAMISGKGVDNLTYNIAANLVTACCGGPLALDGKLHARATDWGDLRVRRYMLADRTANGDNEATAHALAAVHATLAQRRVPGLSNATVDACRAVLARPADAQGRACFAKNGALDSDPITRVEAGWREGPDGAQVYVVMLAQSGVAAAERAAAGQQLGTAATRLVTRLLATR